ncbi:unnamed protein product [Anisakis simplex]|uniref:Uncharacterized protein n=1 Tax=Anisakis simplex TaxID=6269 RepID=A0A3P6P6P9_ANISI|nr:unnamed protein product [Anisakis simplex]
MVEKFLVRVPISEDCLYVNVFAPDWDYSPNDQEFPSDLQD